MPKRRETTRERTGNTLRCGVGTRWRPGNLIEKCQAYIKSTEGELSFDETNVKAVMLARSLRSASIVDLAAESSRQVRQAADGRRVQLHLQPHQGVDEPGTSSALPSSAPTWSGPDALEDDSRPAADLHHAVGGGYRQTSCVDAPRDIGLDRGPLSRDVRTQHLDHCLGGPGIDIRGVAPCDGSDYPKVKLGHRSEYRARLSRTSEPIDMAPESTSTVGSTSSWPRIPARRSRDSFSVATSPSKAGCSWHGYISPRTNRMPRSEPA